MSRSAVVMVVAGAILFGILGVVMLHYWPFLKTESNGFKAVVFGLGIYGAGLAAVMIRRIADPSLPMPVLAWIVAIVYFVFAMFNKTDEEKQHEHMHASTPEKSSSFGKRGTGLGWAIFLTLVGLAMYGIGIALTWHEAKKTLEAPLAPKPKIAESPSTRPTERSQPMQPMLPTDIVDQKDLRAALAIARPSMTDTRDSQSEGAKLLLRWAAARMKWTDVAVAKNETSLELVEKDPSSQLGKRLCVAGPLAKIEKQTVDGIEVHAARIAVANGDAIEMYAVGKTGALVKRKPAKFCGVVTGRYDGGGPPATFAVGMFDTAK